jgi:hypothetical protein
MRRPRKVQIFGREPWPEDEVPPPYRYNVVTTNLKMVGSRNQNGTATIQGTPTITLAEIMGVFDRLPKAVRTGLANSAHDWAPHWAHLATSYAKTVLARPPAAVIERIERADREEALRREIQLLAGQG